MSPLLFLSPGWPETGVKWLARGFSMEMNKPALESKYGRLAGFSRGQGGA